MLKHKLLIYILIYLISILCFHSFLIDAHKRNIITDNLLLTRCQLKCQHKLELEHESNDKCDKNCLENSVEMKKFGSCPQYPKDKFESYCIDSCQAQDYKCPDVQKCCAHKCGQSCQVPDDLNLITDLPPIPQNLTIIETECPNLVEISWELITKTKPTNTILYVLESRAHIGKIFGENKLGDWNRMSFQQRYDTPIHVNGSHGGIRTVGEVNLRPGRWYQFRVAAVNENGTKGYYRYNREFQLEHPPQPPRRPKILKIIKIMLKQNATFNLLVVWQTPKSDLPIIKYKISCSLFLRDKLKNNNHSLYKEDHSVMESKKFFEIKKLKVNSNYFIQLQAISMFGKKRLYSDKKSKVVNTTLDRDVIIIDSNSKYDLSNFTKMDNYHMKDSQRLQGRHLHSNSYNPKHQNSNNNSVHFRKVSNLNIKILPDDQHGMSIKVSWKKNFNDGILELCMGNNISCFNDKQADEYYGVRVRKNNHEFKRKLKYGTNYIVRLGPFGGKGHNNNNHSHHHKQKRQFIVQRFRTPTCENHKKTYPYLVLKC